MVYRIYVEKKPGFDHEASALCHELKSFLGIKGLENVRILNRYDAENIEEALFEKGTAARAFVLEQKNNVIQAQKILEMLKRK